MPLISSAYAQSPTRTGALSGDRFMVEGQEFQLADIMAPPLYSLQRVRPDYFGESKNALAVLIERESAEFTDMLDPSRWGVRRVHARGPDGKLWQEKLVEAGAAFVAPQSGERAIIAGLLRLEAIARETQKGIWAFASYGVLSGQTAEKGLGAYRIVEGEVKRATNTRSRIYLNFGEDYRTDFTAGAASRLYKRWQKAGFDLAALEGRRVRVRGLLEWINGPSIDLKHDLQIEPISGRPDMMEKFSLEGLSR